MQCVAKGKCQKESQAYSSLGQGKMNAGIAGVLSLLTQQPRALEKHARLLVTMRKRILGQSPAVGTRGTMLITQRSDAQRPQRQICSLWYSILISESLPLVTLVSLSCDGKSVAQDIGASVSSQTTWMLLNVREMHTIGKY